MIYLTLFVFAFGNVAVRAFQQINVTHGHWHRIPPTSYAFATFDALVITNLVQIVLTESSVLIAIASMGTAGWMGCFVSMWLTNKLNQRANP